MIYAPARTIDTALSITEESTYTGVCPGPNAINRSIVEDFLTKPYWSSRREAANAGSLTVSQIALLTDPDDSGACTSFNITYQEALDRDNGIGEPAYNVTYYKAGSFYFVVISIRQSDNPSYMATGINFIHVYDQNLGLVKAYAF